MEKEALSISPIFTGLTRPVLFMGVTLDYLSIAFLVTVCLFILGNSVFYLLVYVPLHLTGYLACRWDPCIFRIVLKRADCIYSPNRKIWGCPSYEPF